MLGRARTQPRPAPVLLPIPAVGDDLQFHFSKVTINGLSGGKIAWTVEAKSFEQLKNMPIIRVTGLKQALVESDGQDPLTLTADMLEQYTATGDITLTGTVTVAGKELLLHAPRVTWSNYSKVLQFPQQFAGQVGDYTISTTALVSYAVETSTLAITGPVRLTTGGNVLEAKGVTIDTRRNTIDITGPAKASLDVDDIQAWIDGKPLPPIPRIPAMIQQRYERDMSQAGGQTP
jgi:lipopolysaccharide export system protein LptA